MEQQESFYMWQPYARCKGGKSKQWYINTTNQSLANVLIQRKQSIELPVIFPKGFKGNKFWIFYMEFSEKRVALKTMDKLITKYSYDNLKETADMNEYESLTRINPKVKSDLGVS